MNKGFIYFDTTKFETNIYKQTWRIYAVFFSGSAKEKYTHE